MSIFSHELPPLLPRLVTILPPRLHGHFITGCRRRILIGAILMRAQFEAAAFHAHDDALASFTLSLPPRWRASASAILTLSARRAGRREDYFTAAASCYLRRNARFSTTSVDNTEFYAAEGSTASLSTPSPQRSYRVDTHDLMKYCRWHFINMRDTIRRCRMPTAAGFGEAR